MCRGEVRAIRNAHQHRFRNSYPWPVRAQKTSGAVVSKWGSNGGPQPTKAAQVLPCRRCKARALRSARNPALSTLHSLFAAFNID